MENSNKKIGHFWGRYSSVLGLAVYWLILGLIVRFGLMLYSSSDISFDPGTLVQMFLMGFVFDLAVAIQGLIPLFFYLMLIPRTYFGSRYSQIALLGILWLSSGAMLFGALSEFFFWQEFSSRFNFIAVDYLIYTTEVIGNIRESYPVVPLLGLIGIMATVVTWALNRYVLVWETEIVFAKRGLIFLASLLFIGLSFFLLDSKYKEISENSYNNQLAGNGVYELFSAFRNNELDYEAFYEVLSEDQGQKILRQQMAQAQPEDRFIGNLGDYTREVSGESPMSKPNIVIITVESLSTDFVGVYGNTKDLTPHLDALSKESLWFSRVYATGTRTVRGLEAITLSIPPTPGQSIVRRLKNEDLFSLGSVLKQEGYQNSFLYGGYGYFDNMNDFFEKNSYGITDRTDIPEAEITMENAWGVSDEDIFKQAIKQMDMNHEQGKKTFQMIMTTSNHRPFTYPEGRIDIASGTREGAVKYTDWAIGDFIRQAKEKPWFEDTIFVIIADHQADSAGKTEVPILRYHIPLFIYGPKWIKPEENKTLMSQIDLAPTLLGIIGSSYRSRFMGYDVRKVPPEQGRIFISTYQQLGYAEGNQLVVLNPRKEASFYQIDYETGEYKEMPSNNRLKERAIAWYQESSRLYKKGLYGKVQ